MPDAPLRRLSVQLTWTGGASAPQSTPMLEDGFSPAFTLLELGGLLLLEGRPEGSRSSLRLALGNRETLVLNPE